MNTACTNDIVITHVTAYHHDRIDYKRSCSRLLHHACKRKNAHVTDVRSNGTNSYFEHTAATPGSRVCSGLTRKGYSTSVRDTTADIAVNMNLFHAPIPELGRIL